MTARSLAAFCFVVLGVILTQACGQGDGEVCQIDGDCASGLVCLCHIGASGRGLCRTPGSTMCSSGSDTGPSLIDANVSTTDANVHDAATDANADANTDANVSLDTGVDGSTDAGDDGGTDGGSDADVDAGVDADIDAG